MNITSLTCDVAVVGGGPGGIPAALAAARRGAKVILVERNGHLGGNLVMACLCWVISTRTAVRSLWHCPGVCRRNGRFWPQLGA